MNTIEAIKNLRVETLAPISVCRQAWIESEQKYELALQVLQNQVSKDAARKADRPATQGRVEMYSHGQGRIGVMVEINTETDFAARAEPFLTFCHEIALQIAAMNPEYIHTEEIPAAQLAEMRVEAEAYAHRQGKPEAVLQKIVDGQLAKYTRSKILLQQEYIRDETLTIQDLLNTAIRTVGENIIIQRFLRWEIVQEDEE